MRAAACPMLALLASILVAGCDRHSSSPEQATQQATGQANGQATGAANESAAAPAAGKIDRGHKGEAAPAFAFTGPDGKPTSLAAFRGKPVLLNLWATWCGPCVKELPTLDALAAREAGKLQVVALSQDTQAAKVAPFMAQHRIATLKPFTDAKMAWVPAVADNLPTSILYDSAGHEVWRTVGDLDWTGPVAASALAEAR